MAIKPKKEAEWGKLTIWQILGAIVSLIVLMVYSAFHARVIS